MALNNSESPVKFMSIKYVCIRRNYIFHEVNLPNKPEIKASTNSYGKKHFKKDLL